MAKMSGIYRYKKKLFRYNFDSCVVEWVSKPTAEEIKDNEEWHRKHGRDLWEIEDGMIVNDSIGLRPENWKNKEARNEYLDEWIFELQEEFECELAFELKAAR